VSDYALRPPTVADGAAVASLASAIDGLDTNSSYAYLLWCRDFAATSVLAATESGIAGFITGYRRPDEPGTLFVWQVAVGAAHRRVGLARRMLDDVVDRVDPEALEATVTLGNAPSRALFAALARDRRATQSLEPLFDEDAFPDAHEGEHLLRISPLR
jgi:L-2,4-diaminobutyric acid acetyltransferase